MDFFTKKQIENNPIAFYEKNNKDVFMYESNIINITKEIYILHRNNGGKLNYLYFKEIIPKKMFNWIKRIEVPHSDNYINYLNKNFIKAHYNLYEYKSVASEPDKNSKFTEYSVYRSNAVFCDVDLDSDKTITTQKKYNELLASDYNSIDVWKEQTTEMPLWNSNKIPFWQKTMNMRNYDRGNEGYNDIEESSLENRLVGYGNNDILYKNKLASDKSKK